MAKPSAGKEFALPAVRLSGTDLKLEGATPGNYQRFTISVKGRAVIVKRNDQQTKQFTLPTDAPARRPFTLGDTGDAVEFMNLYARDL